MFMSLLDDDDGKFLVLRMWELMNGLMRNGHLLLYILMGFEISVLCVLKIMSVENSAF